MNQYDPDDIGTVRWFGSSWGAPICDPRAHVPTPVGEPCLRCGVAIHPSDRGVTIPLWDGSTVTRPPHHYGCFMESVLGPGWRAMTGYPGGESHPPVERP